MSNFDANVHLPSSGLEIHFLGKFGSKNQNCLSKMKVDT